MRRNVKIQLTPIILSTWTKMTKSPKLLMNPQAHLNQIPKLLRMKKKKTPKKSEISDSKTKVQKKRLGSTGPVVKLKTINDCKEVRSNYGMKDETDSTVK